MRNLIIATRNDSLTHSRAHTHREGGKEGHFKVVVCLSIVWSPEHPESQICKQVGSANVLSCVRGVLNEGKKRIPDIIVGYLFEGTFKILSLRPQRPEP